MVALGHPLVYLITERQTRTLISTTLIFQIIHTQVYIVTLTSHPGFASSLVNRLEREQLSG